MPVTCGGWARALNPRNTASKASGFSFVRCWLRAGLAPLREALHTNRWKQPGLEKAAGSFLSQKYQTGDPVRQYAAFRIWEGYLAARGAQRPVDAGFAPTEAERR